MMKDRQWARLAGVSGILFVVLTYTSIILGDTAILGGLGEPPADAGESSGWPTSPPATPLCS